jgi:TolB protein
MIFKMKIKPLFLQSLAFLCLLFFISCEDTIDPAFEGTISGKVMDSNNEPLVNVSITTEPATEAILSDSNGNFTISRVPEGEYSINARKEGYQNETRRIRVRGNETSQVDIIMSRGGTGSAAAPQNPSPADASTEEPTDITLAWSPPTDDEELLYDVFLYESEELSGQAVATGISDTSIVVEGLAHNTTYFWQVSAYISEDDKQLSPVWSFRTLELPQNLVFFSRNENGNFNIFSQALHEEAAPLPVIREGGHELHPSLSPDRSRLAYASNQNGEWHIYKADNQGKNRQRITSLPIAGYHNNGRGFTWSPDGGQFLYSHYNRLYKIDENGSNLQLIATAPEGRHWREVDWTGQNGGKIVALAIGTNIYDSEIYLMDADGSNMELLVENTPGQMGSPQFSIDGRRIVYTKDVSGFESETGENRQLDSRILVLELSTGMVSDLSGSRSGNNSSQKPNGTNDLMPDFSPNGAQIIFVNVSNDGLTAPSIYTFNVDGSSRQLVIENGTTPNWR